MQYTTVDHTLLELALTEDLGTPWHDATTQLLFSHDTSPYQAKIISKHPTAIRVCGVEWIQILFSKLAKTCEFKLFFQDGDQLEPGQTLLTISGPAYALLQGERTALNFLRHLCGIATLTAKYVQTVASTSLKILDTRKTTPGFRHLEKYAVQCGGGVNHRMGLYDAIMLKDTHVDLLGGMKNALARLPLLTADAIPVIVEVRSRDELDEVLQYGQQKVQRILLDNMSPALMKQCVAACNGLFATEASGNIHLNTVLAIAQSGVEYASVGELTYNAGQVDLSMYTS